MTRTELRDLRHAAQVAHAEGELAVARSNVAKAEFNLAFLREARGLGLSLTEEIDWEKILDG